MAAILRPDPTFYPSPRLAMEALRASTAASKVRPSHKAWASADRALRLKLNLFHKRRFRVSRRVVGAPF